MSSIWCRFLLRLIRDLIETVFGEVLFSSLLLNASQESRHFHMSDVRNARTHTQIVQDIRNRLIDLPTSSFYCAHVFSSNGLHTYPTLSTMHISTSTWNQNEVIQFAVSFRRGMEEGTPPQGGGGLVGKRDCVKAHFSCLRESHNNNNNKNWPRKYKLPIPIDWKPERLTTQLPDIEHTFNNNNTKLYGSNRFSK